MSELRSMCDMCDEMVDSEDIRLGEEQEHICRLCWPKYQKQQVPVSEPRHCACGACEWRPAGGYMKKDWWVIHDNAGVFWVDLILPEGTSPICPRCFDLLGEGGVTTPAPSMAIQGKWGDTSRFFELSQHIPPGNYALLPLPEEEPE